jgi:hypothetical protein
MFSKIARAPQNRHLQLLVSELAYQKMHQEDIVLDKLSVSDYITSAAFFVVREAEGPNILSDLSYGRKDATSEAEAGDPSSLPTEKNYKKLLKA